MAAIINPQIEEEKLRQAIGWAAFIHLLAFLCLGVIHHQWKRETPFQIVNIRLGESTKPSSRHIAQPQQDGSAVAAAAPSAGPATPLRVMPLPDPDFEAKQAPGHVPEPVAKPLQKKSRLAQMASLKPTEKPWQRERAKGEVMKPVARTIEEYVKEGAAKENLRETTIAPESDEVLRERYTQVLSLWLYKYRDYPEYARLSQHQGQAMIRLRIDRAGRVLFYTLDQTTGFVELDEAIREMVRHASPVPEVPQHYPGGGQLEFVIPIAFTLD